MVGYLGNYLRFNPEVIASGTTRPVVHVEVIAGQDLKGFIEQCRRLEANAPTSAKHLLLIEKEAKPVQMSNQMVALPQGEWFMLDPNVPRDGQWVKLLRGKLEVKKRDGLGTWNEAKQCYGTNNYLYQALRPTVANPDPAKPGDFTDPRYANDYVRNQSSYPHHSWRKLFIPTQGSVWVFRSWHENNPLQNNNVNGIIEVGGNSARGWENFPLEVGKNEEEGSLLAAQVIDVRKKDNPLLKAHATDVRTTGNQTEQVRWWNVEYPVRVGNKRMMKSGWVCERGHEKVLFCSPWAWPGFELSDADPLEYVNWFKRRLAKDHTPNTPLLKRLFELLDEDGNKKISPIELRQGWEKPWLAQTLSRQIIEHRSEWGEDMECWDALDEHMQDHGRLNTSRIKFLEVWEEEKKRIDKLQFWKKVKGKHGFPEDIKVWHMHPLGLVENFAKSGCGCKEITAELLRAISGASISNATLYAPHFIDMFNRFEIKECISKAHILAQMFHESGALQYTKELGQNLSYDPWRGRGLLPSSYTQLSLPVS